MRLVHGARRWLYRGGRPRGVARTMNAAQAWVAGIGVGPQRLVVLEVQGRTTGQTRSLPVVIADYRGERYLVSMLGEHTSWVRNVRAAGGQAALRHGRREAVRLEEVDVRARPPILRRYLECAPGARGHIPVDVEASLEEFERIADRYPVFRVVPLHVGDRPE